MTRMTDWSDVLRNTLRSFADGFEMVGENGACFVETPWVLPDYTRATIVLELAEDGQGAVLSDDGAVARFFLLQGMDLNEEEALAQRVGQVAGRLGLSWVNDCLELHCAFPPPGDALARLLQAIDQAVGLWQPPEPQASRTGYRKHLSQSFASRDLALEEDYEIAGTVETHTFAFGAPSGEAHILLQTLSAKTHSRAAECKRMYSWDFHDVCEANPLAIPAVIINDTTSERTRAVVRPDIVTPLNTICQGRIYYQRQLEAEDYASMRDLIAEGSAA